MCVKWNHSSAKTLTLAQENRSGKRLLIRTAAGPAIGFGHLKRSLVVARHIQMHACPLFLLDPADIWAKEQVMLHGFEFAHFDRRRPWPAQSGIAAVLVDTRQRSGLHRLICEAHRHGVPVASIHDLGLLPLPSDVTIDGSIRPGRAAASGRRAAEFSGTDYLVLDEAYSEFRYREKRISPRIHRVAINLGGGDSSRYFRGILSGLSAAGAALQVVGFPGYCSWGQEELSRADWGTIQFRWLHPHEVAAKAILAADLVISAGGLSAYEALCLGTPLCALAFDRHQEMTVAALAHAGAAAVLHRGRILDPSLVAASFRELDADRARRQTLSLKGRGIVDGNGAKRVTRILRAMMRDGRKSVARRLRKSPESVASLAGAP